MRRSCSRIRSAATLIPPRRPDPFGGVAMTESTHDKVLPELHRAADDNDWPAIAMLLEGGVPIDARDRDGMTALHHAVRAGHKDLSRALLDRGADVNAASAFTGDPHWGEVGEFG